jgi:hypothetical protein
MGGYRDKGGSDVTGEPAGPPPQGEPNTTGSSCPILKGGWAVGRTSAVTQTRPTRRQRAMGGFCQASRIMDTTGAGREVAKHVNQ